MYLIYKITNMLNNKYYIGAHKGEPNDRYMGSGGSIKQAIKKYGKENFIKETLCICTNEESMYFMEKVFVGKEEVADKMCYNLREGGLGGFPKDYWKGRKQSEEQRRKKSLSLIGNTYTLGHTLTDEHKAKLSEKLKGRKMSDEAKVKMSQVKLGNKHTLGYKHTEETKIRMSKLRKEWWEKRKAENVTTTK